MTDSAVAEVPVNKAPWTAKKRVGIAFAATGLSVVLVAGLYAYGPGAVAYVSTDNAYVKSDVTFISSKVAGYVTRLAVDNDQSVRPGQLLIQIDPTDYRSSVDDAEAVVAQQQAAIAQIGAQQLLQNAQIQVADAGIIAASATLTRTNADYARSDALMDQGAVSRQLFESAEADRIRAGAAASQSRSQAAFARKQKSVLAAQSRSAQAQLQGAEARLVRARADLLRTQIVAPREGHIAARNVRLGEYVNTGTRLMAITPTKGMWVEANLRETQLGRIRRGDRVQLGVDALPDLRLCGYVEGYQGASGSEFAVIPPDNATGNFTKIVRRFTVRILLDPRQLGLERLSAGMSVTPSIAVGSWRDGQAHGGLISWLANGSFRCETQP
jgi:membrane fusion protein (multidrug efflux system)